MPTVFLGRQPILDRNRQLYGYELLYRSGRTGQANVVEEDQATASVALDALTEIGLDQVIGDHLGFLNMSRQFFVSELYLSLPPDRVVLEVLENIQPDEQVLAAIEEAARRGYTIALDDFVYEEKLQPFVDLAHVIKVDIQEIGLQRTKTDLERLRRPGLKFLAEKVETYDEFDYCRNAGYDYFQGHFFCHPELMSQRRSPTDTANLVRLLGQVIDPTSDFHDIEKVVEQNVAMSYRMLRYVNSAQFALVEPLTSIRQALVTLGLERIRNCAILMLMADAANKPHELTVTALVRARTCQRLAERFAGGPGREEFFTVGLLSVLDALMDHPMEELLGELPLADHVREALIKREGPLGQALLTAICCEEGNWEGLQEFPFPAHHVRESYLDALQWSRMIADSVK